MKKLIIISLIGFFILIVYNSKMVAVRDMNLVNITHYTENILNNSTKLELPLNKENIYINGKIIGYKGKLPLKLFLGDKIYKELGYNINNKGNIVFKYPNSEKISIYENKYYINTDKDKYRVELFFEDKENIPIPENNTVAGIDRNIKVGFLRILKDIGINIRKYKYTFGNFKF